MIELDGALALEHAGARLELLAADDMLVVRPRTLVDLVRLARRRRALDGLRDRLPAVRETLGRAGLRLRVRALPRRLF